MNSYRTIRLVLGLAVVAALLSLVGAVSPRAAGNVPVDPANVESAESLAWALERYALAGLDLPGDIEVRFHDDPAACEGRFGLHIRTEDGSRIEICPSPLIDTRRTLLHELGHAWAAANLSDAQRDDFVALRQLESWRGEERWNLRGTEHAAEILAWGLDEQSWPPGRLADHDLGSLSEGFELLTGVEPICDTDSAVSYDIPSPSENRSGGSFA